MALGVDSAAVASFSVSPIVSTPTAVRAAVEQGGRMGDPDKRPDTRRAGAGGRARVRRALSLLAQVGPLRRAGQVKTRARARAAAQVGGRATTTAAIWSAQTLPTVAVRLCHHHYGDQNSLQRCDKHCFGEGRRGGGGANRHKNDPFRQQPLH